ncbi:MULTISPECIES: ATP-binding protein [unclassified Streptomyces]|uniref:ATP-binding protein n=1 Tax=unclassified Streptomyces TaxID=2593676 RepID=UPI000F716D9B|nr:MULTISPECIES: ATP-binding protein [unclassified Streptomyces]AZM63895.1 ATP-binding protein [Streptomyces sp. WAC 01438]RSM94958.1 ATP-binding protein [Streptomyces sp. WAC 01420]
MSEEHSTEPAAGPPGPPGAAGRLPSRPAEVREAVARAVSERCRATHTDCDSEALADALLVASELTTNAILHGGGVTDFRVDVSGPGVLLSVSDRSDELPVVVPHTDQRGRRTPGGHGWPIVCRLARDVRVSDLPAGGKCITAVVPLL